MGLRSSSGRVVAVVAVQVRISITAAVVVVVLGAARGREIKTGMTKQKMATGAVTAVTVDKVLVGIPTGVPGTPDPPEGTGMTADTSMSVRRVRAADTGGSREPIGN